MSEGTKLKNLLSKTKPSIQLEVRKKKPTTTADFLEYAKDVEELFQLSNINTEQNKNNNNNSPTSSEQSSSNRTAVPVSNNRYSNNSVSPRFTPGYSRNFNNTGSNYNNSFSPRPNPSNYQSPTNTTSPPRAPQTSQNQYRNTNYQPSTNRNNSSVNSNGNRRFPSQPTSPSSSNTSQVRTRTANTIYPSDPASDIELEEESLSSIFCTSCNVYGHELSSCQNFEGRDH